MSHKLGCDTPINRAYKPFSQGKAGLFLYKAWETTLKAGNRLRGLKIEIMKILIKVFKKFLIKGFKKSILGLEKILLTA